MAYRAYVALSSGCNLAMEYQGKGNVGAFIPDKGLGLFPDWMVSALELSPLNDIAVHNGKIMIELDFRLTFVCYKDKERKDRCTNAKGCKAKIRLDFKFWLDIDYMFTDSPKDQYEAFRDCLTSTFLGIPNTTDLGCILAHMDYLDNVGKNLDKRENTIVTTGLEAFLRGLLDDWLASEGEGETCGTPGGLWEAILAIYEQMKFQDMWKFAMVCACPDDVTGPYSPVTYTEDRQRDINTSVGQEWEDIIAHYVRAHYNMMQTGDSDYMTHIESYDEILVLAATARSQGR